MWSNPLAAIKALFPGWIKVQSFRRSHSEEELYFRFHADNAYMPIRFGAGLGLLLWCSLFFLDRQAFPAVLQKLAMIRFGAVAPVIGWLCWTIVYRPERFKLRMQAYLSLVLAVVALSVLGMINLASIQGAGDAFRFYCPVFYGAAIFQYAFLGLTFKTSLKLVLLNLALLAAAGAMTDPGQSALDSAIGQLLILNGLGMLFCARLEYCERRLFGLWRHKLEMEQNSACKGSGLAERQRCMSAAYHDLQQPLSAIAIYSRCAQSKLEDAVFTPVCADLAVIERAGRDIGAIFEGLRLSCTTGGIEPVIEALDLNALLDEIERDMRIHAERKFLSFRLRERVSGTWIRSDRLLLKRALSNLIGNAIKYTEQGGVLIGAVAFGAHIRIDVRDTGIGILQQFRERIFEENFRIADDADRNGLGLGLSIVRRIERTLPGHRLSVYSRPGKGSRFSMQVPAARCPASPLPELRGKYVVIVENQRADRDELVNAVNGAGALAEGVCSVATLRRLFERRERCPDALIVSLRLDAVHGMAVVEALWARFEWAHAVPVLFISAYHPAEAVLPGFDAPHAICRKPVAFDSLLAQLRDLLSLVPGGPVEAA